MYTYVKSLYNTMAKTKRVKVIVQGVGLSYKTEVDEIIAGQIIAWCLSTDRSSSQSPSIAKEDVASTSHSQAADPNESASEYFNRYLPKRNPDKILTLSCYLKEVRFQKTFTAKDIKVLFRDVGEILPANFTRDFEWASKKNGWIAAEPGSKDGYYVTNTGMKVLAAGFSKEMIAGTKITVRGRGRGKKNKK